MTEPEPTTSVRVLIVDDQQVIREGLVTMLSLMAGLTVVGVAVDGDDALQQITRLDPDVVLMDLKMPRRDGASTIRELRTRLSRARVVVMTTYNDDAWVFSALQAGALGFVTKDAGATEIHAAIMAVAEGQAQLDPMVQRKLLGMLTAGSDLRTAPNAIRTVTGAGLTGREQDVLAQIVKGLDNLQIAELLCISLATVKTHINHLMSKTGCSNRAGLVIFAYQGHAKPPP